MRKSRLFDFIADLSYLAIGVVNLSLYLFVESYTFENAVILFLLIIVAQIGGDN